METRARYILIGSFMLAAVVAVFCFVYWMENTGGFGQRTTYKIQFDTPVYGLYPGSPVLFNGLRAGEVTELSLDGSAPDEALVTIAVDSNLPLREDTKVGVAVQGLTGSSAIALTGGAPDSPVLEGKDGAAPVLMAPPNAGLDWMQSAQSALQKVDGILAENRQNLKDAIANFDTFSGALARNSDKIDGLIDGLASLTGAGKDEVKVRVFGLASAKDFPAPPKTKPDWQLLVPEPMALLSASTEKIGEFSPDGERTDLSDAQWSDSMTTLAGAAIIGSFENAGYLGSVGRPADTLDADFQLQLDFRRFALVTGGDRPEATIDMVAKLVERDGKIVGAKKFSSKTPVGSDTGAAAAMALNDGFLKLQEALVPWTVETIASAPKPAPMPSGDDFPAPPGDDGGMPADGMTP
ncbi:MlaD family protein [Methyloligella sp. 2.7D]|uniref:ABC-type transport auxiliary lipoprotein family protein n=1 Tax=unclassified Methyloligella TaxID=2625955 RepID=UPI00157D63E4|nr:MlaD family protein [Methyloligella sp. GL2]QKP76126.1 MCE family protein [Methyloligella sp. GL2]